MAKEKHERAQKHVNIKSSIELGLHRRVREKQNIAADLKEILPSMYIYILVQYFKYTYIYLGGGGEFRL